MSLLGDIIELYQYLEHISVSC